MSDKKDSQPTRGSHDADQAKTPTPVAPDAGKAGSRELADDELKSIAGGRNTDDFALRH